MTLGLLVSSENGHKDTRFMFYKYQIFVNFLFYMKFLNIFKFVDFSMGWLAIFTIIACFGNSNFYSLKWISGVA